MLNYTVIVEKGREDGFVAFCPALKGCVAQGKTKSQVLASLRTVMEDYIECLIEDGIPVPKEIAKETISIKVAAA